MSSVPYDYVPAVLYAIDKISQGMSPTAACDEANIKIATFEAYVKRDPTLQELYVDAERRGYDAMADALLRPQHHTLYGETNPQMAKVVSDNIKWYLSKKKPKEYGERIEIKHEITLDRAITDAMDKARQRVLERPTIDVEYEEIETPPKMIEGVVNSVVQTVAEDEAILAELLA